MSVRLISFRPVPSRPVKQSTPVLKNGSLWVALVAAKHAALPPVIQSTWLWRRVASLAKSVLYKLASYGWSCFQLTHSHEVGSSDSVLLGALETVLLSCSNIQAHFFSATASGLAAQSECTWPPRSGPARFGPGERCVDGVILSAGADSPTESGSLTETWLIVCGVARSGESDAVVSSNELKPWVSGRGPRGWTRGAHNRRPSRRLQVRVASPSPQANLDVHFDCGRAAA